MLVDVRNQNEHTNQAIDNVEDVCYSKIVDLHEFKVAWIRPNQNVEQYDHLKDAVDDDIIEAHW